MVSRKYLTMVAFAALAMSAPVIAQQSPSIDAETVSTPDGAFVIRQTDPGTTYDPTTFELTPTQMTLGKDFDQRMTMPVQIGNRGTYDFIIDTGSQRTIVAQELAEHLALPALAPVEIVSMAGRVTVNSVQLGDLRFGEHAVDQLHALAIARNDLGSSGIIGLDSLKDKRLTLDFKERRMDVVKSRRKPTRADSDTIVVQARGKFGQLILVDSRIDGRRVNVILDTGAEMSVGNMTLFNNLKTKKLVVPPTPTTLTSVTGVDVPALFAVVRRLTIGTVTLDNVPMVFLDAAPFAELDLADKPAMLLGMRMLRLFDQVAIDFGNRHVDFHLKQSATGDLSSIRVASAGGLRTGM